MKLRRALFLPIMITLAFDIALIVRHKQAPRKPSPVIVAKVGTAAPVESFTTGPRITFCQFDGATRQGDYFIASPSVHGACHDLGYGPPRVPAYGAMVLGFVQTTNAHAGRYPVRIDVSPPPPEPPAPKPAGERKL